MELRELLTQWSLGNMHAVDVLELAESYYDAVTNGRAVSPLEEELISQLSVLNQQLLTKEDIPKMLQLIEAVGGDEVKALNSWRSYLDSIDYEERRARLIDPPYWQG